MRRFVGALSRWLFLVTMLLGSALITAESLVYFDLETLPPFVIEKLPVRFEALWRASLRVHVASALLTFPLCLLLMTRAVQRRPALHRFFGRLTGAGVLFVLVPSGVILAFDAKGGAPVTLGFLLSGAIVAVFMVNGIRAARRGDRVSHARAMRHVVAQMSVAVSSRALIVALDIAGVAPEPSYVVALWGPVLVSAAIAELVSRRPGARSIHLIHTFRRIYREHSARLVRFRIRPVGAPLTRIGR
jgi:uncharacterized membrane protein YozB (DUF420 family)